MRPDGTQVPDGQGSSVSHAASDSSSRARDDGLLASGNRYREIFENTNSGAAVFAAVEEGDDFVIRDFNGAAEDIEGVAREEVVGRPVSEAFPGVRAYGLLPVLQRVWRTGRPEHHPLLPYVGRRHTSWRENYVFRLPSGEVVVVYDDVTARKQAEDALVESERSLREAVEFSPVPMLILVGAEGRFLTTNRQFVELFGYGPEEINCGADWWPRVYPDPDYRRATRTEWVRRCEVAIRDHTKIEPMELRVTCKDGSVRDVEVHFACVGANGIVTFVDLTDRKQAQEALVDANTALRVILEQRHRDRIELERTIVSNTETMVMPHLERLRKRLAHSPEVAYVDGALQTLKDLVYPFSQSLDALTGAQVQLTRREREIATLIRAGKSSSEIAEALYISPATVASHRKSLRRKLGLERRGPWLGTYLARLPLEGQDQAGPAPWRRT
jgi:PAS domain S-box-containing protein